MPPQDGNGGLRVFGDGNPISDRTVSGPNIFPAAARLGIHRVRAVCAGAKP